MSLPVSIVGQTSGVNWETNLNAALGIIDQHNHTPGSGVLIPPAGLNLNSDVTFQGNDAIQLRAVRFTPQTSPIPNTGADIGEIYVSNNDLYYNDVTGGHSIQITKNGGINATSSGISSGTASASFSGGTLVILSNVNVPANVELGSIFMGNAASWPNFLELEPPSLITASYPLVLPQLPGSTSFLTLDTSGNIVASVSTTAGITASNIANGTITTTQISPTAGILGSQLVSGAFQPTILTFTASGTWTVPANVTSFYWQMVGGGGGGGGGDVNSGSGLSGGGAGGGGSTPMMGIVTTALYTPGDTLTITIGGGGSPGSPGSGSGGGGAGGSGGASEILDGSRLIVAVNGGAGGAGGPFYPGQALGPGSAFTGSSLQAGGGNGGYYNGTSGGAGAPSNYANASSGGAGGSAAVGGGGGGAGYGPGGNGGAGPNSAVNGNPGSIPAASSYGAGGGGGSGTDIGHAAGAGAQGIGGQIIIWYGGGGYE